MYLYNILCTIIMLCLIENIKKIKYIIISIESSN